jgi:hypothetical protein
MTRPDCKKLLLAVLLALGTSVSGAPSWQDELSSMPLAEKASELNGRNCARILLSSLRRSASVKALILMPGATDELYFFRRAHARLTNDSPSLLDAITALTNQTYLQATFHAPFVLLHTGEDPLEPEIVTRDEHTAERIRRKHFEKRVIFDDRDWDYIQPILAFDLNMRLLPGIHSHDSHHFFRHTLAACDLNGWEALQAIALAGKTKVLIERGRVVFSGDARYRELPPHLDGFIFDKAGGAK